MNDLDEKLSPVTLIDLANRANTIHLEAIIMGTHRDTNPRIGKNYYITNIIEFASDMTRPVAVANHLLGLPILQIRVIINRATHSDQIRLAQLIQLRPNHRPMHKTAIPTLRINQDSTRK